jgi:hypothetical protein
VLLRVQDEKSVRRTDILEDPEFRGLEDPSRKPFIGGGLMVSERGADIRSDRNSGEKSRMAFYFLKLMIAATITMLGLGGFLLYDAVSQPTNSQVLEVIGGAVLVALGLITLYPQGQLAMQWVREVLTHSSRSL